MPELFRQHGFVFERAFHENADIIINRWYEIFNPEDDEDQ